MSTTTLADKFVRTDDFASRVDGIYLPNEAWAVFAQLEQACTAEELMRQLELPAELVGQALAALLQHGLVRKQLVNWREFLAQKGIKVPSAAPTTAPVAEARAAGRPGAALAGWPKPTIAPVPSDEPAPEPTSLDPAAESLTARGASDASEAEPTASNAVTPPPSESPSHEDPNPASSSTARTPSDDGRPAPDTHEAIPAASASLTKPAPAAIEIARGAEPVTGARVAAVPSAASPRPDSGTVLPVSFSLANEKARVERRAAAAMTISFRITRQAAPESVAWKLNPLLKAIVQKAGGGLAGQLLVYRVFIHVPAEMMHAAGIQSLSLVDDSMMIRDRAFYDVLCQAAHAVAGIDLRTVAA